jgi:hypothetical protein
MSSRPVRKAPHYSRALLCLLGITCATSALGCESDADTSDDTNANKGADKQPLYAMRIGTSSPEGRSTYVAVADSLDAPASAYDTETAREVPGIGNYNVVDGRILVSSGDEPTITSYAVDDDHKWNEGRTLSFADYPLDDNANWYTQYVLEDELVYFPYDTHKRIVWDPAAMEIVKDLDDTSLELERDGMQLRIGGNFASVRYSDQVHQAFYYTDEDWYRFGPTSTIVIYDSETHEEKTTIEAPCPGLQIGTRGDDGYTYFSTDDYRPGFALYGEGPAPCIVRITPDGELDEDFTTDLTEWTDGKYGLNFQYVGNGKAFANIYDPAKSEHDFTKALDPEVANNLWKASPAWSLWIFDLEAGEGHPIEGLGEVELGWSAHYATLDGRRFLLAPYGEWEGTKIYEIDDAGVATEHVDIKGGTASGWRRVR